MYARVEDHHPPSFEIEVNGVNGLSASCDVCRSVSNKKRAIGPQLGGKRLALGCAEAQPKMGVQCVNGKSTVGTPASQPCAHGYGLDEVELNRSEFLGAAEKGMRLQN